jgi:uncharacterized RDD family membrane protein YckC
VEPADGATPADDGSSEDPGPVRYVGLITRGIAFAVDAAIINAVAIVVEAGGALIVSLLHLPKEVKTLLLAISGGVYILWTIGYFVAFWTTTGQTPGNRLMRFRVVAAKGERIKPRRGVLRCIGLLLAALPLFAGYVLIIFDRQRRGLQDRLARTVVVEAPQLSLAEVRRNQRRATGSRPPAYMGRSSQSGDDRGDSLSQSQSERERLTPDSADRTGAPG